MRYILGIDIGGTETKYGVYDEQGIKHQEGSTVTDKETLQGFIQTLVSIIEQFPHVEGIGLSVPGFINVQTGDVINGGAIKVLDGYNLKDLLRMHTHLPMEFENDANCVALAEKWLGNGKEYANFLTVTIGTGIGGGIIINNQLYRGNGFAAGEFGYMFVDGIGKEEAKDLELSQLASTRGLVLEVAKALEVEAEEINGRIIFQELEKENEKVVAVYHQWIKHLAAGMYNLIYCFNPEAILLGGGVSAQPRILEDLKAMLFTINKDTPSVVTLDVCKFRNDSGKIGAVYHFLQQSHVVQK